MSPDFYVDSDGNIMTKLPTTDEPRSYLSFHNYYMQSLVLSSYHRVNVSDGFRHGWIAAKEQLVQEQEYQLKQDDEQWRVDEERRLQERKLINYINEKVNQEITEELESNVLDTAWDKHLELIKKLSGAPEIDIVDDLNRSTEAFANVWRPSKPSLDELADLGQEMLDQHSPQGVAQVTMWESCRPIHHIEYELHERGEYNG